MARDHDLVVVGLGSGGLTAAKFAAEIGLRVAGVERDRIGGDCLWTGCVPSKSLLASAKVAQHMRDAAEFGIAPVEADVDLPAVWRRIRAIQEDIARSEDSAEHLEALGIEVVHGEAELVGPHTVRVGELETSFVLLCTGSRPAVPLIPGLEDAAYLTSESIWELETIPSSFVIVGGGPIAIELAQALNRLGIDVQLIEMLPRCRAREEPELASTLSEALEHEGVRIAVDARADAVNTVGSLKVVSGSEKGCRPTGAPRRSLSPRDARRTLRAWGSPSSGSRPTGPRSSPTSGAASASAPSMRQATSGVASSSPTGPATRAPWRSATCSSLARRASPGRPVVHVHGPRACARRLDRGRGRRPPRADDVRIDRIGLDESDRARADGRTLGSIITVSVKDRLVGAHVLAPAAGELIQELSQAVHERRSLADLPEFVHVYPTLSTSINLLAAGRRYEAAKRWRWLIRR